MKQTKLTVVSLFMLTGVVLALSILVLQPAEKRPQVQGTYIDAAAHNLNVLAIGFNPAGNGENVADKYFSYAMGGRAATQAEDFVFSGVSNDFKQLSNNRINYVIKQKLNIGDFPTFNDGFKYDINTYGQCVWGSPGFNPTFCETEKYRFDYVKFISDYHICQLAATENIDEIWIMSPPYIMTWENFMIGPTLQYGLANGGAYLTPGCTKHFSVINGTYDRLDTVMHDYGHRVEATMSYVTSVWNQSEYQSYWENFSTVSRYGLPNGTYSGLTCGNAHYPANASGGYDYSNTTTKQFNCPDWKNFPNFSGQTVTINCNAWGCSDEGWQKYWLGSLPASDGDVIMSTSSNQEFTFKKDWWYYILYPDNAIDFVNNPPSTPTPSPSPTESPSPSPSPTNQPPTTIPGQSSTPTPTLSTLPQTGSTDTPAPTTVSTSTPEPNTVICGPLDSNNDGRLNILDFVSFAKLYAAFKENPYLRCIDSYPQQGCGPADITGDGKIDNKDYQELLLRYASHICPLMP